MVEAYLALVPCLSPINMLLVYAVKLHEYLTLLMFR